MRSKLWGTGLLLFNIEEKYSKAKKRSKRADHVNNVESTINMLLLFG